MGFIEQRSKLPNFVSQFFEKFFVARESCFCDVVNDFISYFLVKTVKELRNFF